MKKSCTKDGFVRALIDCGMLSKTDKRVTKLSEVDMTQEILYFSKLGIKLENVIDLVYELDKYSDKLREAFLRDLDRALKCYRRYMINYDTNKLIKEITEDLERGISLKDITFKLRTPKDTNCTLRIGGNYYRIKKDRNKILLINEANNRLYIEAENIIIINDKLQKVNEHCEKDFDLMIGGKIYE